MDTFKRQDNEEVAKVCRENNCFLIIVPHNLTNKFQPLDITLVRQQKVSSKRSITYGILNRLLYNITKTKIQQMLKFPQFCLRSNHDMLSEFSRYKYLQGRSDLRINGFKAAGITEVVEKGN